MSKGLKALYSIKTNMQHINGGVVGDYNPDAWDIIEKELKDYEKVKNGDLFKLAEKNLKVLEIIKEKGIVVQFIKETNSVEQYNAVISGLLLKPLTKEEYDLLKEVLL